MGIVYVELYGELNKFGVSRLGLFDSKLFDNCIKKKTSRN